MVVRLWQYIAGWSEPPGYREVLDDLTHRLTSEVPGRVKLREGLEAMSPSM